MSNLISDAYREQLRQLHTEKQDFGTSAAMYGATVKGLVAKYSPRQFVDYGAGKQAIRPFVHVPYIPYDPAIPEIANLPPEADMVMTADVLEHLEFDCLDAVMDDLQRVTRKIGFHVVHTGEALHHLPDGRNAHIIQKPPEWWMPKFIERFDIIRFERQPVGFFILVSKKGL